MIRERELTTDRPLNPHRLLIYGSLYRTPCRRFARCVMKTIWIPNRIFPSYVWCVITFLKRSTVCCFIWYWYLFITSQMFYRLLLQLRLLPLPPLTSCVCLSVITNISDSFCFVIYEIYFSTKRAGLFVFLRYICLRYWFTVLLVCCVMPLGIQYCYFYFFKRNSQMSIYYNANRWIRWGGIQNSEVWIFLV